MVRRIYSEKKKEYFPKSESLKNELRDFLGIKNLTGLRILNRYDVEGLDEETFREAATTIFSEPGVDDVYYDDFDADGAVIAVESLPGQFDVRAESAVQCLQLRSEGNRVPIRYASVYVLEGDLSEEEIEKVSDYLINPVESRRAKLEKPETLEEDYEKAGDVETVAITGLGQHGLKELHEKLGLAMDLDDLAFLRDYFRRLKREPTITEIRVVDTYWSDHCRHTTFGTELSPIYIEETSIQEAYEDYLKAKDYVYGDEKRPTTLMDIATIAPKVLEKRGGLKELDKSDEINACSIKVNADVDGEPTEYLLMFKNETHNHPTEIEPFGGAATCIGGCIRDPLSGRAYVHQAMRITGAADPTASFEQTIPGKLPQRKIVQTAAEGFSSYGNQIGLATGLVKEVYHPGYAAKRLECGAVIGAVKSENVRREEPVPGDIIILLGGRTGRDGIGGATGSSKSHNASSLATMASEVQKGNALEERKLQRLFRDSEVTKMIKRCNDFGAGGVSVAIGELADGIEVDLDKVRKKYEGLDGTELAISESQERMAVVIDPEDLDRFIEKAAAENLEAYPVGVVTENPQMVLKWQGKTISQIDREFLNTNGAPKRAGVKVESAPQLLPSKMTLRELAGSLKTASTRGLGERFDGTIGSGSLLMPYGGITQTTPTQVMAALFPVAPEEETKQASVMSYGFDPNWSLDPAAELDPYLMARYNVINSLAKLVASGADYKKAYLTFQEFFEKLGNDPKRWAKPFRALLGAMQTQLEFGVAAIGGKDSMSGTFLDLDVPPTLISFAIAPILADELITPEFKESGNPVYLADGEDLAEVWENLHENKDRIKAAYALEAGGIAEALMKMSFGNRIGFCGEELDYYSPRPGAIVFEASEEIPGFTYIGKTTKEPVLRLGNEEEAIDTLLEINESVLEDVYPTRVKEAVGE